MKFRETVREYGEIPIGPSGAPIHIAQRLHRLGERLTRSLGVSTPVLTRTTTGLRAGQVVGVLSVPDATIEILPKIDGEDDFSVRRALTLMLAATYRLPVLDSGPSLLWMQTDNLLEVFIRLFAEKLQSAVRNGLPHRYRAAKEDLPVLRGKLDVVRQFSYFAVRPDRLACRFEEFSVDTPLNRVLKSATGVLRLFTRRASTGRTLDELLARFSHVGESLQPLAEPVRLDRTNQTFHRLYRFAVMLLKRHWQSTTSGASEGFGLVFPMNVLFEEFVARELQRALPPGSVWIQHTGRFAIQSKNEQAFALRPDIVVKLDGETIVLDTKWKQLSSGAINYGVSQSDVYQMLVYATALEAKRVILVYPMCKGLGTAQSDWHRKWHDEKTATTLEAVAVNLARPAEVGANLRDLISV